MKYSIQIAFLTSFFFAQEATANYITQAKQAILIDGNNGQILFEYNSTEPMHPSSMTKIMTTYLAFDALKNGKISLEQRFSTSEKAWKMEGSRMFLNYGDTPTVNELLKGIVVQSGNDACVVMAEGLSGSEGVFVQKMNATAKQLNMNQTNFTNASGWPDPNNLSTAKDLSILGAAIIHNFPEYYEYHKISEFTYGNIHQRNRNTLLGRLGVDGIKTGHTEAGGYGIVLSAFNQGNRLIAVINGLQSDKMRREEGEKILSYGMSFHKKILFSSDNVIAKAKVRYGERPTVNLNAKQNFTFLSNDLNDDNISCDVTYQSGIKGPITSGQKLGEISCNILNIYDKPIKTDLIASEEIKPANFIQRIWQNIEYLLSSV